MALEEECGKSNQSFSGCCRGGKAFGHGCFLVRDLVKGMIEDYLGRPFFRRRGC